MSELSTHRILITGANRGIGLEFVRQYSQFENIQIFATCRNPHDADELNQIQSNNPNKVIIVPLEVTDAQSIGDAVTIVQGYVDGLDILINNAGINVPRNQQNFTAVTSELILSTLAVNTIAPLMIVQAFIDLLRTGNNVRVINISSQIGSLQRNTFGGNYAYATSKAGLNMITRSLAADLSSDNIVTITVHPGWVQTDMGGPNASLTLSESITSMIAFFDELTIAHNGGFFNWDGRSHAW